jgi:hypothetical protein
MDKEKLIQVMMTKGHSRSTAEGAIAGRGIADLWREYMGGGGNGGSSQAPQASNLPSAADVANAVIAAVTETLPQVPKYSDNPFQFDEELAREAATAEYTPFYQEQLDDFMQDISTKRQRGVGEERKLLEDLTVERDIGLAERGLSFSGEKKRGLGGEVTSESASPLSFMRDLQRKARDLKVSTKQLLEDLTSTAFKGERDVTREKGTAIESGVLQRRSESLASYLGNVQTQEEGVTFAQPLGVLGTIVP